MNSLDVRNALTIILFPIFLIGCADTAPQGSASSDPSAAVNVMAQASAMSQSGGHSVGLPESSVVASANFIIAKHKASEVQRRVAHERAMRTYASWSPQKKESLKTQKVRYLAVETKSDERTAPNADASVMIWDTEVQKVVGSDVYEVETTPPDGSTAQFESYSAQFVGTGT